MVKESFLLSFSHFQQVISLIRREWSVTPLALPFSIMYLMYYLTGDGKRVYTLQKVSPDGKPTFSAHPGEKIMIIIFYAVTF